MRKTPAATAVSLHRGESPKTKGPTLERPKGLAPARIYLASMSEIRIFTTHGAERSELEAALCGHQTSLPGRRVAVIVVLPLSLHKVVPAHPDCAGVRRE